ncbi:universal stress protein [Hwangdonia lutea]|uniref:Universal stress protein n=1 Tax=Hwangdonia lutea TaxID=3075823 RepID=A0AA97HPG3_9FLAO|nr:universal stress protein [Hwangdonia sp. SCSIO 19198]WOD42961.1 universal stress protein [Hwangdonia sp. SCSIO 19198]
MRKILIPTDFSENAIKAIQYAVELLKYEITEFYLMHAYQDDIYADEDLLAQESLDKVSAIISENSKEKLKSTLKLIRSVSPNPRHSYHIISSNNLLVDEANKIVDEQNIDMIVMGTRGKTNDRKLTFGSHTLQVLKYVQCPVLAIPENYKYTQPKHILFPTDYMIPYKRRELKLLCEIAIPFRAVIDMLYISTSHKLSLRQKDNKAFIERELCKNNINFKIENSKHIINAIYKNIIENNTDILVMVNTRYSFLESMLYQSTIDELSLNLDIPFLALQNMRRS